MIAEPSWFVTYKYIHFYVYLTLIIIGIIGNIIIITYFIGKVYKFQIKKLSPYHFMTIQLAVVDLCLCTCVIISDPIIIYPPIIFEAFDHVKMSLSTTSCWVLAMLSFERCRTIVNPFKIALKKRYILLACLLIWICPALLYLSDLLLLDLYKVTEDRKDQGRIQFAIMVAAIIFDCVLPTTLMGYFYFMIRRTLKKRDREMRKSVHRAPARIVPSIESSRSESSVSKGHIRENKRHRDASKILLKLCIIYMVCVWPPRLVFASVSYIAIHHELFEFFLEYFFTIEAINYFLRAWVYVNSIANVFVYGFLDEDFRHFLLKVLTLGCLKKSPALTT